IGIANSSELSYIDVIRNTFANDVPDAAILSLASGSIPKVLPSGRFEINMLAHNVGNLSGDLVENISEEQIIGTATENTAATGTLNQDLNTFSDKYLTLTGNTTLTFSNTPASGKSFAKTMTIKSNATQTLALPAGYVIIGEYKATGVENYLYF